MTCDIGMRIREQGGKINTSRVKRKQMVLKSYLTFNYYSSNKKKSIRGRLAHFQNNFHQPVKPKQFLGCWPKLWFKSTATLRTENYQQHHHQKRSNVFKVVIKRNIPGLSESFVPNYGVENWRFGQNAGYNQFVPNNRHQNIVVHSIM